MVTSREPMMTFTWGSVSESIPVSVRPTGRPWLDRMERNGSRAMIVTAGRMTTVAGADIGAGFEAGL